MIIILTYHLDIFRIMINVYFWTSIISLNKFNSDDSVNLFFDINNMTEREEHLTKYKVLNKNKKQFRFINTCNELMCDLIDFRNSD